MENNEKDKVPEKIFVVPYRDRVEHKTIFLHYMKHILEGENYKIYIVEQNDKRHFNRGALKNIGFMTAKKNYPNDYKNMTFIFHDIDLLPYKKGLFDYTAKEGEASHYYGFKFLLGGIVAMNGNDYERINGFPNYWAWGWEDNALQLRFKTRLNGKVNRDKFLVMGDSKVLSYYHGLYRTTSSTNQDQYHKEYKDHLIYSGIHSIKELEINQKHDNENVIHIEVNNFLTEFPEDKYVYRTEKSGDIGIRLKRENLQRRREENRLKLMKQQNGIDPMLNRFKQKGKYNLLL